MKTLKFMLRQHGLSLIEATIAMLFVVFINFKLIAMVWNNTELVKKNYLQWRNDKLSEVNSLIKKK